MRRGLVLMGVLGSFLLAGPAAASETDAAAASTLLRLSGMLTQLESVQPSLDQQLSAAGTQLPAEVQTHLVSAMGKAFEAKRLQAVAVAHMKEKMDAARAAKAMEWLRSERGQRITKLEEKASEPSAVEEMLAYADSLESAPPEAARVELILRLDAASGATLLTTEFLYGITGATARAVLAASPDGGAGVDIDAAMAAQRPGIAEASRNMTLVSLLFAYRDLPSDELTPYIEFLESDAGAWYQKTAGEAFLAALKNGTEHFESGLSAAAAKIHPVQ